jgi:hypothetical protein
MSYGFRLHLSLHMLVAGSDCCSESSWQHCDRDRWADTGCAELWCIVSFPCTSDAPEREDMQGIKRLIINKMFLETQSQLLHYPKCWGGLIMISMNLIFYIYIVCVLFVSWLVSTSHHILICSQHNGHSDTESQTHN